MDTLNAGQRLAVNEQRQSNNDQYILIMQGDGNLVLYEDVTTPWRAVWATGTCNLPLLLRPVRAEMQQDGNFVLYSAGNNPAWASGTNGHDRAKLILQHDRNLVIYNRNNEPVWATGTWIHQPPAPPAPAPTEPIRDTTPEQTVGWGKLMKTTATLSRDGTLMVSAETKNNNWFGVLHGHILVVCVDAAGRAIWVSQDLTCPTRFAVADPTHASYGTSQFQEKFPEVVGQSTTRLDIYQADIEHFTDLRKQFITTIKAVVGVVAKELKDEINNELK